MFFKKTVVMLLLSSTSYSSCHAQRGAAIRMSECYVFNISLYVSGSLVFLICPLGASFVKVLSPCDYVLGVPHCMSMSVIDRGPSDMLS